MVHIQNKYNFHDLKQRGSRSYRKNRTDQKQASNNEAHKLLSVFLFCSLFMAEYEERMNTATLFNTTVPVS
jgi:hypothetical protein